MKATPGQEAVSERCWSSIGVWGDHTCRELGKWVHCQNCPILGAGGRALFEQGAPKDYLEEFAKLIAHEGEAKSVEKNSILVFRLEEEWLALPTSAFQSIEPPRTIQPIPHRSNRVLLGLVNIQGGLQLCVSLRDILDIPRRSSSETGDGLEAHARWGVIGSQRELWVFPMDEILGVDQFYSSDLKNVPVTVAKGAAPFTKALLELEGRSVGLLDQELILHHLRKTALQ
jgi:chemotaxis-related protein WspD